MKFDADLINDFIYTRNSLAPQFTLVSLARDMASAREKDRPKERPAPGRYFVFGSSTPRDLSHMNKVPAKFRSYDAKVRKHREGPGLKEYMEKARSLTRNGEASNQYENNE
ncbi:hypothetical protein DICVIV_10214 [Dictyocaulus viviparus]|uniref:Uncharacterized protein n=1 Tax=Dictyocaulus viviparus TaxID=29172 RepID=A0A0D8XJ38_DICVI|nr:hypothetical protein DICVIV_10214 [Dictyocaulus viviparus]